MEATREFGGRVAKESRLSGLAAWIRVLDYRAQALSEMSNVDVFRQSPMTAEEILESGFEHVAVATGSKWRRDGVARWHTLPIDVAAGAEVLTPDDVMAGLRPRGQRVVVFDDDEESLLTELTKACASNELATVRGIGDAWAPGTIAAAVWSGRRFAEEFDAKLPPNDTVPFRREVTQLTRQQERYLVITDGVSRSTEQVPPSL